MLRAAIVLGAGVALFAAGLFIGRIGRTDGPSGAPAPIIGFDASSIQLLDASLELRPIDGIDLETDPRSRSVDAGDAGSSR